MDNFKPLAYRAMIFAAEAHAGQVRKFTGEPYIKHCAEVVAIAMSCGWHDPAAHPDVLMAVAWLHDTVEDTDVKLTDIGAMFGEMVFDGVRYLTNEKSLPRQMRKMAERERLAYAPTWVQTIKLADILSNLPTILLYDKNPRQFVTEKLALLPSLDRGNRDLYERVARALNDADRKLTP